jgi:glucose/arabinose dehydrogenase
VATGNGSSIIEITPSGTQTTFAPGLAGAWGLAFDRAGDLFAADNNSGKITEIAPDGTQSIFATGLGAPIGLAFNSVGDLFAANLSGNIYEFTPGGVRSNFASGLNQPTGLAFQPVPELAAAVTNGGIQVAVTMPSPYQTAIVQVSTDMSNWSSVCTNTPPFTFTNSIDPTLPCRFYRAMLGP